MHRIIALWAHPRSLSTALERAFIERGDFAVMHEPFSVLYYCHEQRAVAQHANFNADEPTDYQSIRLSILQAAERCPVFIKEMCYHCHDHLIGDDEFLQLLTNVFLIRDPRQAIASHYAQNPLVTSEEIGFEKQANIFHRMTKLSGSVPAVVAAEDLQNNPSGLWRALCRRIGVDDCPEALNWQSGQREEWRTWKQWHEKAAQSCGIQAGHADYPDTVDNHSTLAGYFQFHRPYYDVMRQYCLTPIPAH